MGRVIFKRSNVMSKWCHFFKYSILMFVLIFLTGCVSMMQSKWQAPENPSIATFPDQEPIWAEYVQFYYPSWTKHYWVDRQLWGNRGYIYGGPKGAADLYVFEREQNLIPEADSQTGAAQESEEIEKPYMEEIPLEAIETQSMKPALIKGNKIYLVQKGDSLWKISAKEEIYQDPLKWPIIYNSNRDIIDDPDLIYPDQQLIISDPDA